MTLEWTPEHMRSVFESVKNWGRWGEQDEAGALNLITPQKQLEAAKAIRLGKSVSCARELAVEPAVDNPHPALHMMTRAGDDCVAPGVGLEATADFVGVAFHGASTTHIDALCHMLVDGQMYNGFPASEVKSTGARRGSIMSAKDGIVSRGALLDIPRIQNRNWMEPGDEIRIADLEAAERAQGISVGQGDILLVATGRDARRAVHGPWVMMGPGKDDGMAGLHPECVSWLRERDISVLGCDGANDVYPGPQIDGWLMPIHQCTLVAMGVHLLDNLRLDELCLVCAEHEQYDFQFSIAPLRVEGGTGSPCNPIAVL